MERLVSASAYHLEILESENFSPATIYQYRLVHRRFLNFLSEQMGQQSPTVAALNPTNVRRFVAWLRVQRTEKLGGATVGMSNASAAYYTTCLKAWATFLHQRDLTPTNQLAAVKVPKVTRKAIAIFTPEQVRSMLALCRDTHYEHRNRAVLSLLADTGVRISEALGVRLNEYTPWSVKAAGRVKILGKGAKERFVPVGKRLSQNIAAYRRYERPDDSPEPWLFLGQDGKQLTRGAVDDLIKFVGKQAGITGVRLSAHTLRHTWATNAVKTGKAFQVQALLGHSSLGMTQKYVRMAQLDAAADFGSLLDEWEKDR